MGVGVDVPLKIVLRRGNVSRTLIKAAEGKKSACHLRILIPATQKDEAGKLQVHGHPAELSKTPSENNK